MFVYYEAAETTFPWKAVGPLKPQPKIIGSAGSEKKAHVSAAKAHVHLKEGESCDKCGYTRPRKREALPGASSLLGRQRPRRRGDRR